jgi:hypothetical protein
MEFTKNNYLQGSGHGDNWHVSISPAGRKVKSYYEETVDAMEKLYETKTGKFQVLYSGGVDSQYICEIFLKLKMDFEPIIIRLNGNNGEVYNQHDILYAFNFCTSKNIKPVIYDLNFDNFVESGKIIEVAESVNCCSFAIPATLYVAGQLDGYVIVADGDPYLRYDANNNDWLFVEYEYVHSLMTYYEKNKLNGTPYVLSYTPEMMLSFLLDPNIVALGTGKIPGKAGSHSTKSHVYNNGSGFNIDVYNFVTKNRIKFTGYEQIYQSEWMNHPNMQKFEDYKKMWNGEYLELYSDVVKRLSINQYE